MKDYTAVVKRKDSDELRHWKYIKREKVNGKWKYYYKKSPAEQFRWGYELGSKEDPNTGAPLNKDNIDPNVYAKYANTLVDYYDSLNDPFYRGRETSDIKREMKEVEKEITENATKYHMAQSFMGKLGQFVGRTVTSLDNEIDKGKEYLNSIIGKKTKPYTKNSRYSNVKKKNTKK